MRDHFPVLSMLGMLLMMMAGAMAAPLAVSLHLGDRMADSYIAGMVLTAVAGGMLWLGLRRHGTEMQPRHGLLLVTLAWVVMPLFAAIPLLLAFHEMGRPLSFVHAYFETVSGLTTSGGTVISGLDSLPVSVNFWRTFLQWMGGMGLLVLALSLIHI